MSQKFQVLPQNWRSRFDWVLPVANVTGKIGKTLSARYYTKWFFLENRLTIHAPYLPLHPEISECRSLFYTAEISAPVVDWLENLRDYNHHFYNRGT